MGTYHTFVTSLITESEAKYFVEEIRGYLHSSARIIEEGKMWYVTGVIKTYSNICEPLILVGSQIDFGLTWVSDEGHYGSNEDFRDEY